MTPDDTSLTTLISCNKVVDEWARFGLEGLVILALVVMVAYILWLQKCERDSWVETMLCITETLNKAKVISSHHADTDDGN